MRRNSSSTEYSRSWSNSVPPPRPWAERRPTSRIRARLMRSSASSRDLERRVDPQHRSQLAGGLAGCEAERPVHPHHQRRDHEAAPPARPDPAAHHRRAAGRHVQPGPAALGPQRGASSSAMATCCDRLGRVGDLPDDLGVGAEARSPRARTRSIVSTDGRGASRQSSSAIATNDPSTRRNPAAPSSATTTMAASSATSARRRVGTGTEGDARSSAAATGAPARPQGCRRARRRRWLPRARAPGAPGSGGAASAWPRP